LGHDQLLARQDGKLEARGPDVDHQRPHGRPYFGQVQFRTAGGSSPNSRV
jgi:hypothetical protein